MKACLSFLIAIQIVSCAPVEPKERVTKTGAAGLEAKKFSDAEYSCYETEAALALAAGTPVTYNDHLKPLVAAKCATCHAAKGTSPDLSTYEGLKLEAEASLNRILAGTMPMGGALPAAEQELFKQWVEGGTLEAGEGAPATEPGAADALPAGMKEICRKAGQQESGGAAAPAVSAGTGTEATPTAPAGTGSGPEASGSGSASGTGSVSGTGSTAGSGSVSGTGTGSDAGSGSVLAVVNYNEDIKAIIDGKCVSCHAAGKTAPNLATYAGAKTAGAKSLARIDAGTMPPSASDALTVEEKALFKAWSDAGFPEVQPK